MVRRTSFGLVSPSREVTLGLTSAQEVIELAPKAESQGFDSVWLGDSLLAKPRLDPLTMLAAMAVKTQRIKLGTAILLNALRNPFLLAQQWATLDHIARGRTIMGVGIGGGRYTRELFVKEFEACGVKFSQRMQVMEEMIELVRLLWSTDQVNYRGKFLAAEDISLHPRPFSGPCPIWIACSRVDVGLRRVARLGDGWIANILHPDEFQQSWQGVQSYATEYHRSPPTPVFYMYLNLAEDREAAGRGADEFLAKYYNTRFSRDTLERWGPFGPRSMVVDRIDRTIAAGATGFILHFASLEPEAQMTQFANEILPSF